MDASKSIALKRPFQPSSKSSCSISLRRQHPKAVLQSYLEDSATLSEIHSRCESIGCIAFKLPPFGSLAGKALKHCLDELSRLFDKHSPLIFKIGWTHDAAWRWANDLYGYARSIDKWTNMDILYIAKEPFSPAMLEAALIEKYQSGSQRSCKTFCGVDLVMVLGWWLDFSLSGQPRKRGLQKRAGWWGDDASSVLWTRRRPLYDICRVQIFQVSSSQEALNVALAIMHLFRWRQPRVYTWFHRQCSKGLGEHQKIRYGPVFVSVSKPKKTPISHLFVVAFVQQQTSEATSGIDYVA